MKFIVEMLAAMTLRLLPSVIKLTENKTQAELVRGHIDQLTNWQKELFRLQELIDSAAAEEQFEMARRLQAEYDQLLATPPAQASSQLLTTEQTVATLQKAPSSDVRSLPEGNPPVRRKPQKQRKTVKK